MVKACLTAAVREPAVLGRRHARARKRLVPEDLASRLRDFLVRRSKARRSQHGPSRFLRMAQILDGDHPEPRCIQVRRKHRSALRVPSKTTRVKLAVSATEADVDFGRR